MKYNPWNPITDRLTLKHIGKLLEETGELVAALSRCQIQGIDEAEPVTGKVNRIWLEEELADVQCNMNLLIEYLKLDTTAMTLRVTQKAERLKQWHAMT